jgi:hypothetical protein
MTYNNRMHSPTINNWHSSRLRSLQTTCTMMTYASINFNYRILLTGIQFPAESKYFLSVNITIKQVLFPTASHSYTVKLTPHLKLLIRLTMYGTLPSISTACYYGMVLTNTMLSSLYLIKLSIIFPCLKHWMDSIILRISTNTFTDLLKYLSSCQS